MERLTLELSESICEHLADMPNAGYILGQLNKRFRSVSQRLPYLWKSISIRLPDRRDVQALESFRRFAQLVKLCSNGKVESLTACVDHDCPLEVINNMLGAQQSVGNITMTFNLSASQTWTAPRAKSITALSASVGQTLTLSPSHARSLKAAELAGVYFDLSRTRGALTGLRSLKINNFLDKPHWDLMGACSGLRKLCLVLDTFAGMDEFDISKLMEERGSITSFSFDGMFSRLELDECTFQGVNAAHLDGSRDDCRILLSNFEELVKVVGVPDAPTLVLDSVLWENCILPDTALCLRVKNSIIELSDEYARAQDFSERRWTPLGDLQSLEIIDEHDLCSSTFDDFLHYLDELEEGETFCIVHLENRSPGVDRRWPRQSHIEQFEEKIRSIGNEPSVHAPFIVCDNSMS